MAGFTTHLDQCGDDQLSRVKASTALYQPAVAVAGLLVCSALVAGTDRADEAVLGAKQLASIGVAGQFAQQSACRDSVIGHPEQHRN